MTYNCTYKCLTVNIQELKIYYNIYCCSFLCYFDLWLIVKKYLVKYIKLKEWNEFITLQISASMM